MDLTPKQIAWSAFRASKREPSARVLVQSSVVHAPAGSPIRAYRRAVAVVERADLTKKPNRKVRKAIARGTRLARSRQ
jgi:hypothetical protein